MQSDRGEVWHMSVDEGGGRREGTAQRGEERGDQGEPDSEDGLSHRLLPAFLFLPVWSFVLRKEADEVSSARRRAARGRRPAFCRAHVHIVALEFLAC